MGLHDVRHAGGSRVERCSGGQEVAREVHVDDVRTRRGVAKPAKQTTMATIQIPESEEVCCREESRGCVADRLRDIRPVTDLAGDEDRIMA